MKRYKVIVKEKKPSKVILHEGDEVANTEKSIHTKYRMKFPFATIKVTRMKKTPGRQVTLEEGIEDVMKEQGRLEL